MRTIKNYAEGRWVTPEFDLQPLASAITSDVVAQASTSGLDFGAMTRFARETGGARLRALTFHERAKMLKALADALTARKEELSAATDRGEIDAIADFAGAIPVEIIGNLLNVPHEDRAPLRDWSLAILGALEPTLTPAQRDRGEAAVSAFLAYLQDLVAARRKAPGDPATDVLTRLIAGVEEGALSERELLHNCIFLLNAGHETTTNLIGNGLWLLAQWPAERHQIVEDPSLLRGTIEEMLRLESSNQLGNRRTVRATDIAGVSIAAGTPVTVCIGAANRDPDVFVDPDRFDPARSPNRHLAFGAGVHQCAGMNLARLEARVALAALLKRFPDFALAGPPQRTGRARFRGFSSLPIRLETR